jgi:acyl-CoA thioester hydrolase
VRDVPTTDQVRALTPVFSRLIPASYVDRNAHMNVLRFFDLQVEASATVMRTVGLTDEYIRTRRMGFFTAEHHVHYFAEVLAGHRVTAYARFVSRSNKAVHNQIFLVNDTTGLVASRCQITIVHVDQTTRRPIDMPPDIVGAIDALIRSGDSAWAVPRAGREAIRASSAAVGAGGEVA